MQPAITQITIDMPQGDINSGIPQGEKFDDKSWMSALDSAGSNRKASNETDNIDEYKSPINNAKIVITKDIDNSGESNDINKARNENDKLNPEPIKLQNDFKQNDKCNLPNSNLPIKPYVDEKNFDHGYFYKQCPHETNNTQDTLENAANEDKIIIESEAYTFLIYANTKEQRNASNIFALQDIANPEEFLEIFSRIINQSSFTDLSKTDCQIFKIEMPIDDGSIFIRMSQKFNPETSMKELFISIDATTNLDGLLDQRRIKEMVQIVAQTFYKTNYSQLEESTNLQNIEENFKSEAHQEHLFDDQGIEVKRKLHCKIAMKGDQGIADILRLSKERNNFVQNSRESWINEHNISMQPISILSALPYKMRSIEKKSYEHEYSPLDIVKGTRLSEQRQRRSNHAKDDLNPNILLMEDLQYNNYTRRAKSGNSWLSKDESNDWHDISYTKYIDSIKSRNLSDDSIARDISTDKYIIEHYYFESQNVKGEEQVDFDETDKGYRIVATLYNKGSDKNGIFVPEFAEFDLFVTSRYAKNLLEETTVANAGDLRSMRHSA